MLGSRVLTARGCALRVAKQHVRSMSLAAPEPQLGFLESIFSRSKMPRIPCNEEFPGLPMIEERKLKTFGIETSTLDNGVRIVSVDSSNPVVSVGAFVDSGSRYENPVTSGISHFLEFIAFKSTKGRSDFRLVRDMQKHGINVVCSTSREHTVYAADGLAEYTDEMVHTLGDVIQNPLFHPQELNEAYDQYATASQERAGQPDLQIMEAIHAAAYHNNTLGRPLYCPANISHFDKAALEDHTKNFFTGARTVVAGVGVAHSDLVAMVGQEFGAMPRGERLVAEKAQYTGGDIRLHNQEPLTHVALAFETASWHSKDVVAMCVLQMMMGGGGSFSAGGPGKGMYSRLYRNVLNACHWVESANSFNSIFTDSSIFGIYGTSLASESGNLVNVLSEEFLKMAGKPDDMELHRAKQQLTTSVHMQLESRSLQLEDIGRQLITFGEVQTAQQLCDRIAAVSAADVQRVASTMIKTPLSLAVYGDQSYVPRFDAIAKRFG